MRDFVCDRIRDGIHRVDTESQNEGFNRSYPYKGGPLKSWNTINENRYSPAPQGKAHIRRDHIRIQVKPSLIESNSWISHSSQGRVYSEQRVGTAVGFHRAGYFFLSRIYVQFDFGVDSFKFRAIVLSIHSYVCVCVCVCVWVLEFLTSFNQAGETWIGSQQH